MPQGLADVTWWTATSVPPGGPGSAGARLSINIIGDMGIVAFNPPHPAVANISSRAAKRLTVLLSGLSTPPQL